MEAVRDDADFDLKNPRTGETVHTIRARMLMDQIATLAWRTGDPGLINLDAINRNNPLLESMGPIEATNPCGEQPLHPFDACNLGSVNLARFVKKQNGVKYDRPEKRIDWNRLAEVTRLAVRILDNVIDACAYPLPEIAETVRKNRRIGLGVMGWADMLFQLGVAYDSDEGVALAERVMAFIQKESWLASEELAAEKGVFPKWNDSAFSQGWDPLTQKQVTSKRKSGKLWKVRNVAITTIAPTGTISMAADTSSGIEPVFALSFVKHVVEEEGLNYVNRYFERALKREVSEEGKQRHLISEVTKRGSARGIDEISKKLQKVYVTAHDVRWEAHVRMQAAFQKYSDNAVSKTINFPATAGIEEVMGAYLLAWELGCKGITVYRDQSKSFQVLGHAQEDKRKKRKPKREAYLIQSKLKVKTLKERKQAGLQGMHSKIFNSCPECGGVVSVQEGCNLCHECGWSVCTA
jgi:ribonucleoside-diphosphate reductase alpha chain